MTGTVETFSEVLKITNKLVGFKSSLSFNFSFKCRLSLGLT